jgi:O-6-methylguanine DNA methyltransferase
LKLVIGYLNLKTRVGDMWLAATPRGLFWVEFGPIDIEALKGFFDGRSGIAFQRGGDTVEQAGRELLHYLEGRLRKFSVKLDLTGASAFSRKVWNAARRIPYGQVRTYGWIAEKIGDPYCARAVGGALGKNPVPIFVPCHRVVGSHGWLGGFSAGLRVKESLLAIESGQSTLGFSTFEGEDA